MGRYPNRSSNTPETLEAKTVTRIAQDFARYEPLQLFDRLLWTWPLRLTRIKDVNVCFPNATMSPGEREASNRKLEEDYGDRDVHGQLTYENRRKLLHTAVQRLKRHAEEIGKPKLLLTVFEILLFARDRAIFGKSLPHHKLLVDRARRLEPNLKTYKKLRRALEERKRYLEEIDPVTGFDELHLISRFLQHSQRTAPTPPTKLPRGQTASPAADWARAELSAAGIPLGLPGRRQALARAGVEKQAKNLHDALLMAVGILRYGSPRS